MAEELEPFDVYRGHEFVAGTAKTPEEIEIFLNNLIDNYATRVELRQVLSIAQGYLIVAEVWD